MGDVGVKDGGLWRLLLRVHVTGILILSLFVLLGSSLMSVKWVSLSNRTQGLTSADLRSTKSLGADIDFARKVLFTPSFKTYEDLLFASTFLTQRKAERFPTTESSLTGDDTTREVQSDAGFSESEAEKEADFRDLMIPTVAHAFRSDEKLSFFIKSHEKELFKMRRRLHSFSAEADFDMALVCGSLSSRLLPESNSPSSLSYSPITQSLDDFLEDSCPFLYKTGFSELLTHRNELLAMNRRCVIWGKNRAYLDKSILPITALTKGLFTPEYPLRSILHTLLVDPIFTALVVLIVWSHSIALPQPVSVIHAPRLAIYAVAALWRYAVLYHGLNLVEHLGFFQGLLQRADSMASSSRLFNGLSLRNGYGMNETDFQEAFDFSDHIVHLTNLLFIFTTEGFCLWKFRQNKNYAAPKELANQQHDYNTEAEDAMQQLQSKDEVSTGVESQDVNNEDNRRWSDEQSNAAEEKVLRVVPIDNPLQLTSHGLFVYTAVFMLLIIGSAYLALVTATFFHSPLEAFIGLLVGVGGIFGPFWALLFGNWAFARHFFGLTDEETPKSDPPNPE